MVGNHKAVLLQNSLGALRARAEELAAMEPPESLEALKARDAELGASATPNLEALNELDEALAIEREFVSSVVPKEIKAREEAVEAAKAILALQKAQKEATATQRLLRTAIAAEEARVKTLTALHVAIKTIEEQITPIILTKEQKNALLQAVANKDLKTLLDMLEKLNVTPIQLSVSTEYASFLAVLMQAAATKIVGDTASALDAVTRLIVYGANTSRLPEKVINYISSNLDLAQNLAIAVSILAEVVKTPIWQAIHETYRKSYDKVIAALLQANAFGLTNLLIGFFKVNKITYYDIRDNTDNMATNSHDNFAQLIMGAYSEAISDSEKNIDALIIDSYIRPMSLLRMATFFKNFKVLEYIFEHHPEIFKHSLYTLMEYVFSIENLNIYPVNLLIKIITLVHSAKRKDLLDVLMRYLLKCEREDQLSLFKSFSAVKLGGLFLTYLTEQTGRRISDLKIRGSVQKINTLDFKTLGPNEIAIILRMDLTAFVMSYIMITQQFTHPIPENIQHRWDNLSYDDLFNQILLFHNRLGNGEPTVFLIAIYQALIDKLLDTNRTLQTIVLIYNLSNDPITKKIDEILSAALKKLDQKFVEDLGFSFFDFQGSLDNNPNPPSLSRQGIVVT